MYVKADLGDNLVKREYQRDFRQRKIAVLSSKGKVRGNSRETESSCNMATVTLSGSFMKYSRLVWQGNAAPCWTSAETWRKRRRRPLTSRDQKFSTRGKLCLCILTFLGLVSCLTNRLPSHPKRQRNSWIVFCKVWGRNVDLKPESSGYSLKSPVGKLWICLSLFFLVPGCPKRESSRDEHLGLDFILLQQVNLCVIHIFPAIYAIVLCVQDIYLLGWCKLLATFFRWGLFISA